VKLLMPLPDTDFDTTEVAVPWRLLTDLGHQIEFATEAGQAAPRCDPRLLAGVIFGQLGAFPEPRAFYQQLASAPEFAAPVSWRTLDPARYDGLILAGGHAPGMRQYLGSAELQARVASFWALGRPVAAICHGVLVLARSKDPATGRSVLQDKRTTCLPRYMERSAYLATAWRLGRYYRTYPAYVQDEVTASLRSPRQFRRGPLTRARGSAGDDSHAFVVQDGSYLSARWPGDAYLLARRFHQMLTTAR
jgi:putative intracellular protease/amidase